MNNNIEQIQELLGISLEQAQFYLEMTNNNLDQAVQFFFEQQNEQNSNSNGILQEHSTIPEWFQVIWPNDIISIPDSWLKQKLEFDNSIGLGLLQYKNGPCGVLAVLQAVIISQQLDKIGFNQNYKVNDLDITNAIYSIIWQCKQKDKEVLICGWKNDIGKDIFTQHFFEPSDLQNYLKQNICSFKDEGGLLLLIYSLVLTKGVQTIKQEIQMGQGQSPMIEKPHYICNTDLLMLLMTGKANGNVGAYDSSGNSYLIDTSYLKIGLLSTHSLEAKIPINDGLLSPQNPVWVLHGGDHFTVVFYIPSNSDGKKMELFHWNGLPPAGPRMTALEITLVKDTIMKAPSLKAYKKQNKEYREIPGQIYDVVQACPVDKKKKPNQFETWKYEVILAQIDPAIDGPNRPDNMQKPQTYQQGEPDLSVPWKCSRCYYKRFQTMCFGQNSKDNMICQYCQKPRQECGWSIWLSYEELDSKWKKIIDTRFQPKIITVLHTKWPKCKVKLLGSDQNSAYPSV